MITLIAGVASAHAGHWQVEFGVADLIMMPVTARCSESSDGPTISVLRAGRIPLTLAGSRATQKLYLTQ